MPYLSVEDFKGGLDRSRMELTSEVGTLQTAKNVHITRGGEIQKSKKFVSKYSLPAGLTFGLASLGETLYVFGSGTTPGSMPAGIEYQQLQNPDGSAMTDIIDISVADGNLYVLAEFADGTRHHFFDGAIIDDWYEGLVRSSMASIGDVATQIANAINADSEALGATASSSGNIITITSSVVNDAFTCTAEATNGGNINDQTIVAVETQAATGALPEISTVTLGGTLDPGDLFSVTIDDRVYGASPFTGLSATSVASLKGKIYATADKSIFFSGSAEPAQWKEQNEGSGFIDISSQGSASEDLTALGIYQNNLAIFSRNNIQIWSMDADPASNLQLQVLDNIGTDSRRTVLSYASGDDVFFLADSGLRSLKARDSSNSADISDIGTPIDDIVVADMAALSRSVIQDACAVIDPIDGRYICALNNKMYVFSFFRSKKVSAWSTWEKGIVVDYWARAANRIYARVDDTIYLYGGDNNDEYDAGPYTVILPYFDATTIATFKTWCGLDVACEGEWTVYANTNPNDSEEWVTVAVIDAHTITEGRIPFEFDSPVIKFKFESTEAAAGKIGRVVAHYQLQDTESGG